jgi:protein-S-isoprenylcysteine O-methyltransferase Ste14
MEQAYDYGMWVVVAINAVLFIGFLSSYLAPARKREWRSFSALTAFIIALFAEMYGFPLTIYLLALYLGRLPFADPFAHASGNLWASLFLGPEWSFLFMAFGFLPILLGGTLVAMGWKQIHRVSGELVTDGIYATIRHPQYAGLFLAILGSLIWWPSVITILMAPVLLWSYDRLAKREERELEAQFGEAYRRYRERVPAFVPRHSGGRLDEAAAR